MAEGARLWLVITGAYIVVLGVIVGAVGEWIKDLMRKRPDQERLDLS